MTTIKISDNDLDRFYSLNPNFDILEFNLSDQAALSQLDWENLDRETILELLKKYQRLLWINPDPEIAKKLLKPSLQASEEGIGVGLDSAHAIASMSEEQFVKMRLVDEEDARQTYKNAIARKAKIQLLWANMKDTVASPYFRSMRVSTVDEGDRETLSQQIPSYQEMFGDLDYLDCDHCSSILGPAAYLVDLMRIVDQYITEPNQDSIRQAGGLTLGDRRPNLADIKLTCENTNNLVPSLQIINRILEARVKKALDSSDALQSLAKITYPFNLPFNFPLEQIRSYLGHLQTDLATIHQTFAVNELAIAREYIELSWEEYNLITNSETNEEELKKLYGIEDLESLTDVETFLKQTGLSRTELPELLKQNLHQDELDAGLAHNFYINQVLEGDRAVHIKIDESNSEVTSTIEHLIPETLDRINRFIRLAKKLNWSFTDLDWVLTSIQANEIDEEAIKKIAKIKKIQAKYKLPLDVLCSFWHDMKTIGVGSNPEKPEDLFDRVFNNPFKEILGDAYYPLPDESKQINLNNLDREAETNPIIGRILAALRLNVNQLIDIAQRIWGQEGSVNLTVQNLSQLFRISQILRLLGLNIEEYQGLLSFLSLDIKEIGFISIDQIIQITELAEWVKESQIKIDELDYVITSNLSSNLDLGYSESDITERMKSLWRLAIDSLLKPSDFIGAKIDQDKSSKIFNKLLEKHYIEEITSNYKNVLKVSFGESIAIVLDSAIKIDEESLKEIINDEELLDENQRQKQTQHLQEILQQAYDKQKEELKEIASLFAIEADLAASLLDFASVAFPTIDYVRLLHTPWKEEQEEWSEIVKLFRFLSRILLLTQKLELTTTELKCITDNKQAFGIDELSQSSIRNIQTIDRFKKLIKAFNDDKNKLVEYIASIPACGR